MDPCVHPCWSSLFFRIWSFLIFLLPELFLNNLGFNPFFRLFNWFSGDFFFSTVCGRWVIQRTSVLIVWSCLWHAWHYQGPAQITFWPLCFGLRSLLSTSGFSLYLTLPFYPPACHQAGNSWQPSLCPKPLIWSDNLTLSSLIFPI